MLLPANYIEPKKIVTNFDKELSRINTKFWHAGYPVKVINYSFFQIQQRKRRIFNTEMVIWWKKLLLDYLLHPEMRNLVSVLLVNYKLLPVAKSDLTLKVIYNI